MQIVTLLLHQQRVAEALQHFRSHMGLFKRPPFVPPLPFKAAHWGWVSRQYAAMGELISRVDPSLLPPQVILSHHYKTRHLLLPTELI